MIQAMILRTSIIASITLALLMPTPTQGAFTPDQVWTYNWETYVDLQPGNSNVASTNWDFATNKWEEVYVDGDEIDNVGDTDEHQGEAVEGFGDNLLGLDELTMTLTGLDPNTNYDISAVVMSEASNDADEWGITAGFASGVANQTDYCCANMSAAHVNRDFNNEWLARVPMGTTTSNSSGEIIVYFNENANLDWDADSQGGSVVDGLIYGKSADVVTPTQLITSADRKNGATDDDLPFGIHDGEQDPLASDEHGLRLGARTFSDRVFHVDDISEELVGADYVRNFLNDKGDDGDFSYDVTLSTDVNEVFLMVLVDDRFELGGGEQQTMVDTIVEAFADAGDFVDTGYDVDFSDSSSSHPLSAFGMLVPTKDGYDNPITYTFGAVPNGSISTYMIAALATSSSRIPGDTNNDNEVNETDASILAGNWGGTVTAGDYTAGDFNGDGLVNGIDASILAANWTGSSEQGQSAGVPEPGIAMLLLSAMVMLLSHRRNQ